jgi:hypothetical protein
MPQGDGTGPIGQGPMTGRGLGHCAGFAVPGFMNGFGRGRGFGRGFRRRMMIQPTVIPQEVELTSTEEKKILEANLKDLKTEINEIEKRLKELSTK